ASLKRYQAAGGSRGKRIPKRAGAGIREDGYDTGQTAAFKGLQTKLPALPVQGHGLAGRESWDDHRLYLVGGFWACVFSWPSTSGDWRSLPCNGCPLNMPGTRAMLSLCLLLHC